MQAEQLCLTDGSIFAFAQGHLSAEAVADVERHLSLCSDCRSVVAATAQFFCSGGNAPADPDPAEGPLSAGMTVSRYVISGIIGAGAAGIVYRAYDPQLRRQVALKLLRTGHARGRESLKSRLLREAQAMAQLSHPNVVNVFDVGTYGDEIFVVLELVEGQTLAQWLAQRERTWDEIRAAFHDAGKGLAAAHGVQLVHRDFKPANVLVGADGRVRVTDFGLARPMDVDPPSAGQVGRPADAGHLPLFTMTVTGGGGLAGTPVYMAPEQFAGRRADGRSDQFSFCVALYIALYRRHPYFDLNMAARPHALEELARTIGRGELHVPEPRKDVPAFVFQKLRRGLAVDPADRFSSMEALLEQVLAASHTGRPVAAPKKPGRAVAAGLGLAAGVVLLAVTAGRRPTARPAPPAPALAAAPVVTAAAVAVTPATAPAPERPQPVRAPSEARRRHDVRRRAAARARPTQYFDGLKDPFQ